MSAAWRVLREPTRARGLAPAAAGECDCSKAEAQLVDTENGHCFIGSNPCVDAPTGFLAVPDLCGKRADGSHYR
jgi:hypothetical protein